MSDPLPVKALSDVVIVVPTRNRASQLERTLQNLLLQTIPTQDFEVVVVDNDSGDETPEFLRRFGQRFPNWQCFRQPKPGAAAARNAGIASCQGAIVLFIDDDVIAEPDLVRQHLKSHDSHPGCAVLGRVLNGWNQNDSAFHWVITLFGFPTRPMSPFNIFTPATHQFLGICCSRRACSTSSLREQLSRIRTWATV